MNAQDRATFFSAQVFVRSQDRLRFQGHGDGFTIGGVATNHDQAGSMTVTNSVITGNLAQGGSGAAGNSGGIASGGGINNDASSSTTIANGFIASNKVVGGVGGGVEGRRLPIRRS